MQCHQHFFILCLCHLLLLIVASSNQSGVKVADGPTDAVDRVEYVPQQHTSLLRRLWAAAQHPQHWYWPILQQHGGMAKEGSDNTGTAAHGQSLSMQASVAPGEAGNPSRRGRQLLTSHRIAGVGTGIFIFFLFLAFCICLCIIGTRTKMPWVVFTISTTILVIVILALFTPPRGEPPEPPATGYDSTIDGLIAVMVLLCVGIVAGALGMVVFVAAEQQYARPLSYHLDIDQTW